MKTSNIAAVTLVGMIAGVSACQAAMSSELSPAASAGILTLQKSSLLALKPTGTTVNPAIMSGCNSGNCHTHTRVAQPSVVVQDPLKVGF